MEDSPLNRLPPESLKRVSTLALSHDEAIPLSQISSYNGLTQTCRQMREHTRITFWQINPFRDEEPTDKLQISNHAKQLQDLLSPEIVKNVRDIEVTLELRTATPQSWNVSIKVVETSSADCEKVIASGNDRIAQGKLWIFSRYLDKILDAYQRAGFEVYATRRFGKEDGEVRKFWAVCAGK